MSTPSKLESFFNLLGPLADTNPKRVALVIALAYLTYRFFQINFQPKQNKKPSSPPPERQTQLNHAHSNNIEQKQTENENEFIEEKVQFRPNKPRTLSDIKEETTDQSVPISEEMLTVANSGYTQCNGGYRWFLATNKWCFFTDSQDTQDSDTKTEHFALESNIGVDRVYNVLRTRNISFEWDTAVIMCYIISDIDSDNIYYAAPQTNRQFLPRDSEWICVQGSGPTPQIFANLCDKTGSPDPNDTFGNVVPNDEEMKSVFGAMDVDHTGLIGGEKVREGFQRLGYAIDSESVNKIMSSYSEDGIGENEFCVELKKYASAIDQQNITFDNEDDEEESEISDLEEKNENGHSNGNGDNGVIVHQEVDEDEEDDESISDLE